MDEALLRAQIAEYLADESKLYRDCFKEISQFESDPNFILVAADDPEGDKSRWWVWFEKNKSSVQKFLCTRPLFKNGDPFCRGWNRLRAQHASETWEHLIVLTLIDVTTPIIQFHLYHTLPFLLILAVNGMLDKLCDCPSY